MVIMSQKKTYNALVTRKIRRVRHRGVIGALKDRIEFVERTNKHTNNGSGPYLEAVFNTVFICWANHQKRDAINIIAEANINEDFTDVFAIRKEDKDISTKLFIRFNNKVYNIQGIIEYDEGWLLFKCKESGSDDKQVNRR